MASSGFCNPSYELTFTRHALSVVLIARAAPAADRVVSAAGDSVGQRGQFRRRQHFAMRPLCVRRDLGVWDGGDGLGGKGGRERGNGIPLES